MPLSFKHIILQGFILLLLLLYIYSIKFTFLPVTGKVCVAGLGVLLYALNFRRVTFAKSFRSVLMWILILFAWSILSYILNGGGQLIYTQLILSFFSCFFASYVISLFVARLHIDFYNFLSLIFFTVVIESVCALFIRFSPSVQSFFFALQEFQTHDSSDDSLLSLQRVVGLGEAVYFGVLPSCTLGFAAFAYLMQNKMKAAYRIIFILLFILTGVVSFLTARYALFPFAVFCGYMYIQIRKKISTACQIFILVVIALFLSFLMSYLKDVLPAGMYEWAFEAFDSNSRQDSNTINELQEWWTTTNFPLKTLLIGDTMYTTSSGYYGGSDVGFFRQIWYGGVIGLLIMLKIHWTLLKSISNYFQDKKVRQLCYAIMLAYLLILAKGDTNLIDMLMFLLVVPFYSKMQLHNERI